MSSARIDLAPHGFCSFGIDRTKPAILDPYMQDHEWQTFCDGVDHALKPVIVAMKAAYLCFGLTFLASVICIIATFASVASSFGSDPWDSSPTSSFATTYVFFAIPVAMGIIGMCAMCFAVYRQTQARIEIQNVCSEASQRQSRLSFHVRYERHYYYSNSRYRTNSHTTQYIEVSINNVGVTPEVLPGEPEFNLDPYVATPAVPVAIASPADPYSTLESGEKKTPKERLEHLEATKDLLTEEEYSKKRKEILADM